jgi:hypothetical protein
VLRDELAGWIGSLDKYTSARGSAADRAFFLQAHNGGPYVVDRVIRGLTTIDNLLLTICGGIQPDRLRQLGDLTGDGLWQRFAPIVVAPAQIGTDERSDRQAVADYNALIKRLLLINGRMIIQLADAAHDIRDDVARRVFEFEQSEALGSAFSAFCGKLTGLWGRLCLVLSQIDPRPVPYIVPGRIADGARTLLFDSVLPNAARVYLAMGAGSGNSDAIQAIAGFILTKQKLRLVASDLTRNLHICRARSLEEIQRMLSPFVAGGWLTPEQEFNPMAWSVHPAVHTVFAERCKTMAERRAILRTMLHDGADASGA